MKKLIIVLLALMTTQAFSKNVFVMTKSIRIKNLIRYDVAVKDCRLADKPLDTYWILGEKQGQRQELKPDETKFAPEVVRESSTELEFVLPVFSEIDNEVVDHPILVKLVKCEPKAFLKINNEEIELNEVHAKVGLLGLSYILIKGKRSNGTAFTYKIDA